MATAEVVRVFVDHDGRGGNPLGLVVEVDGLDDAERQAIARQLDYSETVFIEDAAAARLRIFTRERETPFAGHPAVGAAWFLGQLTGTVPDTLLTAAGDVPVWQEEGNTWVRAPLASTPPWWHERLDSPAQVDHLTGPQAPAQDATQLWAWEDEAAGTVRARTFAARFGTPEDEATGSASMRLAAALGRSLTIRHGRGSIVLARPGPPGYAELGGRVMGDGPRRL